MSEELKDTKVSDTETTVDKTEESGTVEKKEETTTNVEDVPTGGITMNEEIDSAEEEAKNVNDKETKEDSSESKPTETKSSEIKVVAPEPATLNDITTDKPNNNDDGDDNDAPPLPTRTKTVELEGKATAEAEAEAESKPKENPLLKQLQDAFPSIEEKYIRAIIIASKGSMDPAFNALLYLSDPKSGADIPLPSKQPSPSPNLPSRKKLTQLEQDELLAKQLNDQYNNNYKRNSQRRKGSSTTTASSRLGRRTTDEDINEPIPFDSTNNRDKQLHAERLSERRRRLKENGEFNPDTYQDDEDDSWGQFVEKDLPEITARANKSLQDTASRVGNWFNRNFGSDEQQQQSQAYNNNNNNANAFGYNEEQMREQEDALRFYENQRNQPTSVKMSSTNNDSQNERRRFNSFGQRIGEDSLENHGISLNNDEFSDDEDVPPQLPTRERTREGNDSSNENGNADSADPDASMVTHDSQRVVSQTTYIDTPDKTPEKKWQPVPPEPIDATPTKINATSNKNTDPDADDFMINSDDE